MNRLVPTTVACALLCAAGPSARADGRAVPPSRADARAAPPTRGSETIVVDGGPARGGLGDLTGDAAAARDRLRALAGAAFVSFLHLDERLAEHATLAEVVAGAVGTHVRSLGGLGAFTSLSVRGASSGHTAVLVDGVPLSRLAAVTADLGKLELAAFDEVALYRGGVPAGLGGAGVGGALALTTRVGRGVEGDRLAVSAGVGSFGARHLRARWGGGDPGDGVAGMVELGYAGATGDFPYFDDRGTNLDRDDDRYSTRGNNGYDHGDAVARFGGALPEGAWSAGGRALARRQGLPGTGTLPASAARLDTASAIVDGRWRSDGVGGLGGAGATLELSAFGLLEQQRFVDLLGEVTLRPEDRRYRTTALGGAAGWALARGRHRVAAGLDARLDLFADDEQLRGDPRVAGRRLVGGLALSDDVALAGGRWIVSPAVRLEVARTEPIADRRDDGLVLAPPRTDVEPSPRVATRVLAGDDVALKAGAGWYVRAPTVTELYGDRGFLVGTPHLQPERGPSVDAGVVYAPARALGAVDRVLAEAAAFAAWPRDTIALVSAGGLAARPLNVGSARLAGVELSASARLGRAVTLAANYTFLHTEQRVATPSYDGQPLPQRPRHAAYARVDAARTWRDRPAVLWADATYVAGNVLDQAGRNALPARRLLGVGVKLGLPAGMTVGVELDNLLDARVEWLELDPAPSATLRSIPRAVSDVAGYPLPGRAAYLSVEWRR